MEAYDFRKRGIKRGMALARAKLVLHAYDSGRSYKEIADFMEADVEDIRNIIKKRRQYVIPEEPRVLMSI